MIKKIEKGQINPMIARSATSMLEQDEYLDLDLNHVHQYTEIFQDEQGGINFNKIEDDIEFN